jgi:hypothetical protein
MSRCFGCLLLMIDGCRGGIYILSKPLKEIKIEITTSRDAVFMLDLYFIACLAYPLIEMWMRIRC